MRQIQKSNYWLLSYSGSARNWPSFGNLSLMPWPLFYAIHLNFWLWLPFLGHSSWWTSKGHLGKFSGLLYFISKEINTVHVEGGFPSCVRTLDWRGDAVIENRKDKIHLESIYNQILLDIKALFRHCWSGRCSLANWDGLAHDLTTVFFLLSFFPFLNS